MNEVILRGYLRDIKYSHTVKDVDYEKANLICPGKDGREDDIISLRYKKFVNKHQEGDFVDIVGNLRSYSYKEANNKSHVELYVFTYFDLPEILDANKVLLDGNICKRGNLEFSKQGKQYIHFIIANNIFTNNRKLNSYISCTAYGQTAIELSNSYNVKDYISIEGELHSHTFKKDNEYKVAHEVVVKNFQ